MAWMFLILSPARVAYSQCSMCKAGAESNINKSENKIGRGLNNGILYMMSVPYLMGGIAFIIWYKHKKRAV